jgi:hypothetical protein
MKRTHGGGNDLDFKAIREAVDLAALITQYQGQPRGRGRTARWLCPFHDDRHTPGLALTPDGQHFKCWTCNSSGDAIDFLAKVENIGKAEAALRLAGQPIGKPQGKPIGRKVGSQGSGQKSPRAYPTPEAALEAAERFEKKRHVATWVYQNLDRTEALRVSRFEGPSETSESGTEKAYRPFHRQAGGKWVIADPKGKLPLYRLPELVEAPAARVWIGEGEKVVDHAVGLGLVATTSAHGAQSPERTDWLPLAGRELVLMPDNNQAGEAYAAKVSQILADLDPRPILRILRLAGLPEGGDLVEWLEAHDSWDETQCRQELERLADLVPPLDFNHAPSSNGFRSNGKPRTNEELGLTTLSTVVPVQIEWLWPNRIPQGKLTILAGEGGVGKSFLSLSVATIVSRGATWPDLPTVGVRQGHVVVLTAEDDLADTIVPRLKAMGANLEHIHSLGTGKDSKGKPIPITLGQVDRFKEVVARHPATRLVIVDPLPSFLPSGVDDHKNSEVREALKPLIEFAFEHRITIIGITHFGKTPSSRAVNRVIGSVAYANLARAVWCVVSDPEDETRRLMLAAKHNLTGDRTGMAYRIVVDPDGSARVEWEPAPVDTRLSDVLGSDGGKAKAERRLRAIAWLQELLAKGPVLSDDVKTKAAVAGFGKHLIWEVRAEAGVIAQKGPQANAPWYWTLAPAVPEERQSEAF